SRRGRRRRLTGSAITKSMNCGAQRVLNNRGLRSLLHGFNTRKEKCFVLDQRTTDRTTELVQTKDGRSCAVEEIPRIEGIITKVFQQACMERLGRRSW